MDDSKQVIRSSQEKVLYIKEQTNDTAKLLDRDFLSELKHELPSYASTIENSYSTDSITSTGEESCRTPQLVEKDIEKFKTSNLQCLMHVLKGNLGPGLLAIPDAIKDAGLLIGTAGVLVMAVIAVHCMHILVNCSHILSKRVKNKDLDYGDAFETCLETGPPILHKLSKGGRYMVNTFLILTQMGFCCVYIVFISRNIQEVVDSEEVDIKLYMLATTILLNFFCYVKNLRTLVPFSLIANVFNVVGLIVTYEYLFQDLPNINQRPSVSSWTQLPLYFGTLVYSFEGISLVLPLNNNIKDRNAFRGCFGVLTLGMTIVTALFASIGFYGYLRFGDDIEGSITLNLPENEWLYIVVKLMFSVSVFVSYGIQIYVPFGIIWPFIEKRITSVNGRKFGEYGFRTCLVLLSLCFAMVIPHLDLLISLVGAFASSALALMFPPIIEIITLYKDNTLSTWILLKDVSIFLLGIIGFLTGTYSSLLEIAKTF